MQANGETGDDVRRVARLGSLGDFAYRREFGRGVVIGDRHRDRRHGEADQRRHVDRNPVGGEKHAGQRQVEQGGHHRAHADPGKKGARWLEAAKVDHADADHRGDDRKAADHEGKNDVLGPVGKTERGDQHAADQAHRVGLEDVGGHAGAVADVVADVVGDGRRVAGIVLIEILLDLADEVGTHIRRLRVNAAANTRKNRDEAAAQSQTDNGIQRPAMGRVAEHGIGAEVKSAHAQQRQPDHQQAGDRTAVERHPQRRLGAEGRSLGRADIGDHRHAHADVAGKQRTGCTDEKPERSGTRLENEDQDEKPRRDAADGENLPAKISLRPFLDRPGDFAHLRRAGIGPANFKGEADSHRDGDNAQRQGGGDTVLQ